VFFSLSVCVWNWCIVSLSDILYLQVRLMTPVPPENVQITENNDTGNRIRLRLTAARGIRFSSAQRNAWNLRFRELNSNLPGRITVTTRFFANVLLRVPENSYFLWKLSWYVFRHSKTKHNHRKRETVFFKIKLDSFQTRPEQHLLIKMHISNKIRQNMLPRKRYPHLNHRILSSTPCLENDSPGTPEIDFDVVFFPHWEMGLFF